MTDNAGQFYSACFTQKWRKRKEEQVWDKKKVQWRILFNLSNSIGFEWPVDIPVFELYIKISD